MISKKFLIGLIGSACLINSAYADAAIVSDKLPLLTYADHIVYTYDKPNGKKIGSITPSKSLVMIKKIHSDGWAYGSYKMATQNKRINHWFKMSDLQGYVDFKNYEATAYQDFIATRTRTGSYKLGHIAKNDKVIVIAERGDSKKVIFTDEGNRYRMGWIPNYVLAENAATSNNNFDVGINDNFDDNNLNTENIPDSSDDVSNEPSIETADENTNENISEEDMPLTK